MSCDNNCEEQHQLAVVSALGKQRQPRPKASSAFVTVARMLHGVDSVMSMMKNGSSREETIKCNDAVTKNRLFVDDETDDSLSLATGRTSALTGSIVSSIHDQRRRRSGARRTLQGGGYAGSSDSSGSNHNLPSTPHALCPRTSRPSPPTTSTRKRANRCQLLQAPEALQLRGQEAHFAAWNTILGQHGRQFVLVAGESGNGKSRLVHELTRSQSKGQSQRETDAPSLWTLGGKFDSQHNLPYSAFSLIFEDLYYSLFYQAHEDREQQQSSRKRNSCAGDGRGVFFVGGANTAPEDSTEQLERNGSTTSRDEGNIRRNLLYAEICHKLKEALDDEESMLLIKFIPALRPMLLVNTLDFKSDLEQLQENRLRMGDSDYFSKKGLQFQRAFKKVLRVLTRCFGRFQCRPVLVLDDLQWADSASLELLEAILTDAEEEESSSNPASRKRKKQQAPQSLIVVACYRTSRQVPPDEVEHHPLQELLERLESSSGFGVGVHRLQVDHVSLAETELMLSDMISSSLNEHGDGSTIAVDLARHVYNKTSGNPFDIIQCMRAIYDDSESSVNSDDEWKWEELWYSAMANEATTEMLLLKRFRQLPLRVIKLLPLIASLGFSFQRRIFTQVVEHFHHCLIGGEKDIALLLINEGLIGEDGAEWYIWMHNRIHEATFALVESPEELKALQFDLAEFLLDNLESFDLDQSLFVVANLFERGGIVDKRKGLSDPRRVELTNLYLRAAMKAIESASFDTAASYANLGIEMLPQTRRWTMHYELSLDLFSTAAQAAYCIGDFERMQVHCEEVIAQHFWPLLDKQRVYNVLLDSLAVRGSMEDASRLCIDLLDKLGCKLPKPSVSIFGGLKKTKAAVKNFTKEDPSHYGIMRDPQRIWAMKLLNKLLSHYVDERSPLMAFPALKILRWNRKYGVCESSIPAFAGVGFLLSAQMGDFAGGEVYASRAISLLDQSPTPAAILARTYLISYGYVLHWTTPYAICRASLMKGYAHGMKFGDIESAHGCYLSSLWLSHLMGHSLDRLVVDLKAFLLQAGLHKQTKLELWATICLQAFLNLIGSWENMKGHRLIGQILNEEEMQSTPILNLFRLYVAFYFGEHHLIVKFIEKHGSSYFEKKLAGTSLVATITFQSALSCLAVARLTGRSKYERMALAFTKKVKTWVDKANPNVLQYRALLDAEWATYKNKHGEALHTYGVAVMMAERRGLVQDIALAHERWSDSYARIGSVKKARHHAIQAKNMYEQWGASAVARRLMGAHPDFFHSDSQ